jgi:hypothetical protein
MEAYTSPGYVPVTQQTLDDAEADARAIYGVPDDWAGTANDWLVARITASIEDMENEGA